MDKSIKMNLDLIDARMGSVSTEEQQRFAEDFTRPLISFSNPGTGKSYSIIKGLIAAQTIHGIPGRNINAMSYTREATAELKVRYVKACKRCDMVPTVTFNTFHSICNTIVREKYPGMKIKDSYNWEDDLSLLQQYMSKYGFECDDFYYIKRVMLAIDNLNRSLIYAPEHVELAYRFRELNMDIKLFQELRKEMFMYYLIMNRIPRGDIPNYALYVLANNPDICEKYRKQYKIMVVDEFQDMTKLYLVVLSMISSNLIAIGDMKQQIYGFNGACAEIVDEYMKIYPNARRIDLTQSFRCAQEISDYATRIYHPNDPLVKPFTGAGQSGSVTVIESSKLDVPEIVSNKKESSGKRSSMFLFRNNFSATPIAEELYKQKVPFMMSKFTKVMGMPIFKELSEMAYIAQEPDNLNFVKAITWLFPEMKRYKPESCPVIQVMEQINKKNRAAGIQKRANIFDIPYRWSEQSSIEMLAAMKVASEQIKRECSCGQVFNTLIPVYSKYIIEGKWWKLEEKKEFYYDIVAPIVNNKTFPQMVAEEYDKEQKIIEATNVGYGVRCFTMHSAKGLEADDVYIIDAEANIFPSQKNMKKYIELGCEYDAARVLREERNLLYVAITRAKDNVVITHRGEVTQLISNPLNNDYTYLDEVYAVTKRNFDDVAAFLKMLNLNAHAENITVGGTYTNEEKENSKTQDSIDEYDIEAV